MLTPEQLQNMTTRLDRMPGLSVRSKNGLEANHIRYVAEYLTLSKDALSRLPKLGAISRDEIKIKLDEMGFKPAILSDYKDDFDLIGSHIFKIKKEHDHLPLVELEAFLAHERLDKIFTLLANVSITIGSEKRELAGEVAHKRWLEQRLPEELRKGLKTEFLDAVLTDPKVQQTVEKILIAAVSEKLGLSKT